MTKSAEDNKTTLKVLFVQASELSRDLQGVRLELFTKEKAVKIKSSFLKTEKLTVDSVTEQVLAGGFDAVLVEDAHTFDHSAVGEGFPARDAAYAQLGLTEEKKPGIDMDPNYPLSGIALVQYLKKSFEEAGITPPKIGYTEVYGKEYFKSNFEAMGIEDNADFYLSAGYGRTEEDIQTIYDVLGVD